MALSSKPLYELASIKEETVEQFFSYISPNSSQLIDLPPSEMNKPFRYWISDWQTIQLVTKDMLGQGIVVCSCKGFYIKIQQMEITENLYICKFMKCFHSTEFNPTTLTDYPSLKYEIPFTDNYITVNKDNGQIIQISSEIVKQLELPTNTSTGVSSVISKPFENYLLGECLKENFMKTITYLYSLNHNYIRSYLLLTNNSTTNLRRIPYISDIRIFDEYLMIHLQDLRIEYEMNIENPLIIIDNNDTVLYANDKWKIYNINSNTLLSREFKSFIKPEFRNLYNLSGLIGTSGQILKLQFDEDVVFDASIHAHYYGFEQKDECISTNINTTNNNTARSPSNNNVNSEINDVTIGNVNNHISINNRLNTEIRQNSLVILEILRVDMMNTESSFEGASLLHDIRNKVNSIVLDIDKSKENIKQLENNNNDVSMINNLKETIQEIGRRNADLREDLSHRLDIIKSANSSSESTFVSVNFYREIFKVAAKNCQSEMSNKCVELSEKCDSILTNPNTYVLCDKCYLKRAFENLLFNAIKFTPYHGTITFSALLDNSNDSSYTIIVRVKDTGTEPIDESQFESVFGIFTQTKNKKGGYGIGLSFVRLAAARHHGSVCVESSTKSGTCIKMTLTLKKSNKPEDVNLHEKFVGKSALIIDDAQSNILLMNKVLDKLKITGEGANDSKSALSLLKQKHYDIIFVDKVYIIYYYYYYHRILVMKMDVMLLRPFKIRITRLLLVEAEMSRQLLHL